MTVQGALFNQDGPLLLENARMKDQMMLNPGFLFATALLVMSLPEEQHRPHRDRSPSRCGVWLTVADATSSRIPHRQTLGTVRYRPKWYLHCIKQKSHCRSPLYWKDKSRRGSFDNPRICRLGPNRCLSLYDPLGTGFKIGRRSRNMAKLMASLRKSYCGIGPL